MPSGEDPGTRLRDLTRDQWWDVARSTVKRAAEMPATDTAGTLAYYGFLSLFPGLIVIVALLAIFGEYPGTYDSIIETLRDTGPGSAVDLIDSALETALRNSGSAGGLLGVGLAVTLFTASASVAAAVRALEDVDPKADGRDIGRSLAIRLALTLGLLVLVVVAFGSLLIAGPVFATIAERAGLDASARTAVGILRWPVGLAALFAALVLLYWIGPGRRPHPAREHVFGALVATGLGVVASLGFSVYVANFGNYNATYGVLGAVIVLLTWLFVLGLALVIGAIANVELRRVRGQGG